MGTEGKQMNGIEWKHGKPDCLSGYESPVTVCYEDMLTQIKDCADGQIMAEIKMHVDVDRDELIKAMNYDRNQYATGYRNGYADAQKHGKWISGAYIKDTEVKRYSAGLMYCSVCKHEAYSDTDYGEQLFDYCPYCGSRMQV